MYAKTKTALVAAAVAIAMGCATAPAQAGHSTGTWRFLPYGLNAGGFYGGASPQVWAHGGPYEHDEMTSPYGRYSEYHHDRHGWSHRHTWE